MILRYTGITVICSYSMVRCIARIWLKGGGTRCQRRWVRGATGAEGGGVKLSRSSNQQYYNSYHIYMYLQMLIIWPLLHISLSEVTVFKPIDIIMLYSAACNCLQCKNNAPYKYSEISWFLSKYVKHHVCKLVITNLDSAPRNARNYSMNYTGRLTKTSRLSC